MLKSMLVTVAAAVVALVASLAPFASQASTQVHGLRWHYVGNPYSSCGGYEYVCNGMRELQIWFTYPAANWEDYKIRNTAPPCGRLAIPPGGFCLQFTASNLMQGNVSYWSFNAEQWPNLTMIEGYNSSGSDWSFSITVASDSLGNLAFGDGWVMTATNGEYSVISEGPGSGGKDEVTGPNGGYALSEHNPGTWTDPPVDIVAPDAASVPCSQTICHNP